MDRTYNFKTVQKHTHSEARRKIAFHESGHAAAVYLRNLEVGLPPVFFQIFINSLNCNFHSSNIFDADFAQPIAKLEGGRLINNLPASYEVTKNYSTGHRLAYQRAYEADIVNLFAGPLAEAFYVAQSDNEYINPELLTMQALKNYGGLTDLAVINEYLDCFMGDEECREVKKNELFQAALSFINERSNWHAITALAELIMATDQDVIKCDEIILVLSGMKLEKLGFESLAV